MELNLTLFFEENSRVLYLSHLIISIILSTALALYSAKRFKRFSDEIDEKDKKRLDAASGKSLVYKILFKASLHKNNGINNFLFLVLFNLAMPVIGYLFSIWIVLYLRHVKHEKKVSNTNILNLDEFQTSFLNVERVFGEGSMVDLMSNEYAPKAKKLKALSSLATSNSSLNLKIIRETLSSSDDEIRMFGYSIINKAEKNLNQKINHQLEKYNEAKVFLSLLDEEDTNNKYEESSKLKIAESAYELAHLYWEMVYTELSHDSLKKEFLTEVIKYVKIAKNYYMESIETLQESIIRDEKELNRITMLQEVLQDKEPDIDAENIRKAKKRLRTHQDTLTKLCVLMGRVYMKEEKYDSASTEFIIAQELSTTYSSTILPYVAEIHFLLRNYKVVYSVMDEAKRMGINQKLFPIVEQWKAS